MIYTRFYSRDKAVNHLHHVADPVCRLERDSPGGFRISKSKLTNNKTLQDLGSIHT